MDAPQSKWLKCRQLAPRTRVTFSWALEDTSPMVIPRSARYESVVSTSPKSEISAICSCMRVLKPCATAGSFQEDIPR
ncbi:hypothetical protein D3C81_2150410 [compost metagenome]